MDANMTAHIPGVPNVLTIMLEQLASKNSINGWNIYENKNGHVCMNIRFIVESGNVSKSHVATDILSAQYRRVSPKQQERNLKRVQEYKSTITTRSMAKETPVEDIEHARASDNDVQLASFISVDECVSPLQCSPSLPVTPVTPLNYPDSPGNSRSMLDDFLDPESATVISLSEKIPLAHHHELETPVPEDSLIVDTVTQAGPSFSSSEQSSQTNILLHHNRAVQCVVKFKSKPAQTKPKSRTHDYSVQVGPDLVDYSVQASVATSDRSEQVGTGLHQLVSSSSQVILDSAVAVEDKSSEITSDLVNTAQKHSQTQFLCPGFENDPNYDPYWIGRHCLNSACRYAGRGARRCGGPLYKCTLCNIVMCLPCKSETVHNEICEDRLQFYNNSR